VVVARGRIEPPMNANNCLWRKTPTVLTIRQ
jgi:hypothetical protein